MNKPEVLGEKAQEKVFARLLKKPENQECADCPTKGPRWASLDFGIFVCMNCSGAHRHMGPSVTRVKSTKLDTWVPEFVEILDNIGNKTANEYWEQQLNGAPRRLTQNSTLEERIRYIQDKYIRKRYADQNGRNPVAIFLENKANGVVQPAPINEQPQPAPSSQQQGHGQTTKTYFSASGADHDIWNSFESGPSQQTNANPAQKAHAQVPVRPSPGEFNTYSGQGTKSSRAPMTAAANQANIMDTFDEVHCSSNAHTITTHQAKNAQQAAQTDALNLIEWNAPPKNGVTQQQQQQQPVAQTNGTKPDQQATPSIDFQQLYKNSSFGAAQAPFGNGFGVAGPAAQANYYAAFAPGGAPAGQQNAYNAWGQAPVPAPVQVQPMQAVASAPVTQTNTQPVNIMALYGNKSTSATPNGQNFGAFNNNNNNQAPQQNGGQHDQKIKVDASRYDFLNQMNQFPQYPQQQQQQQNVPQQANYQQYAQQQAQNGTNQYYRSPTLPTAAYQQPPIHAPQQQNVFWN